MADSTLHFAVGLAAGTTVMLPALLSSIRYRRNMARHAQNLLAVSYLLATFATVPNILGHLGLPDHLRNGWWMNIFLLHPTLDRLKHGGTLIGGLLLACLFILHYALLLTAIARTSAHRQSDGQTQGS